MNPFDRFNNPVPLVPSGDRYLLARADLGPGHIPAGGFSQAELGAMTQANDPVVALLAQAAMTHSSGAADYVQYRFYAPGSNYVVVASGIYGIVYQALPANPNRKSLYIGAPTSSRETTGVTGYNPNGSAQIQELMDGTIAGVGYIFGEGPTKPLILNTQQALAPYTNGAFSPFGFAGNTYYGAMNFTVAPKGPITVVVWRLVPPAAALNDVTISFLEGM